MDELKKILKFGTFEDFRSWVDEEVVDIEYTNDRQKNYLGAKLYVTMGGPTCWIDTSRGAYFNTSTYDWKEYKEPVDCFSDETTKKLNAWMELFYVTSILV